MGQAYLIDTNVVIDYLNDKLPDKSAGFVDGIDSQLSIISKMELLAWPGANDQQIEILQSYIDASNVFPLSEPIVAEAIRLRKNYRIKLPDAIIAATALVFDLTLITHNVSDFKNIKGLKLINSYEP